MVEPLESRVLLAVTSVITGNDVVMDTEWSSLRLDVEAGYIRHTFYGQYGTTWASYFDFDPVAAGTQYLPNTPEWSLTVTSSGSNPYWYVHDLSSLAVSLTLDGGPYGNLHLLDTGGHGTSFSLTQSSFTVDGKVIALSGYGSSADIDLTTNDQDNSIAVDGQFYRVVVRAGSGDDVVRISAANPSPNTSGAVVVYGEAGNDHIDATGAWARASLEGGDGADTVIGGLLNDSVSGGAGDDSVSGGPGVDTVWGDGWTSAVGQDTIVADHRDGNNLRMAPEDALVLLGSEGNDGLWLDPSDTRAATSTPVGKWRSVTIDLLGGDDRIYVEGAQANMTISGGAGDDLLEVRNTATFPLAGTMTLAGGGGVDLLRMIGAGGGVFHLDGDGGRSEVDGWDGTPLQTIWFSGIARILDERTGESAGFVVRRTTPGTTLVGDGEAVGDNILRIDAGQAPLIDIYNKSRVTIDAVAADGVSAAGTVVLSGTDRAALQYLRVARAELVVIEGTAGDDAVDLAAIEFDDTLRIRVNGAAGNDSVAVAVAGLELGTVLEIDGGDGDDGLSLDYSGYAFAMRLRVEAAGIVNDTLGTAWTYAGVERLSVTTGAADDGIGVARIAGMVVNVNGGDGGADALTVFGTEGADALLVRDGSIDEGVITFANVEALTVDGLGGDDYVRVAEHGLDTTVRGGAGDDVVRVVVAGLGEKRLSVVGGAGADQLQVNGTAAAEAFRVRPGAIGIGVLTVRHGEMDSIQVSGGAGNDLFTVKGQTVPVTVGGNDGDDALTLLATNARPVKYNAGSGVDAVRYVGTEEDDVITVARGKIVAAAFSTALLYVERITVEGRGGNDVLDASTSDVGVTLLGGDGDDRLLGSAHADLLLGGSGEDTVVADEYDVLSQ